MMISLYIYRTLYQSNHYIVRQNLWHRWLAQHDGTIHTCINRWAIFKPYLKYTTPMIALCNQNFGKYLMLGLGGGAILHALEHKLANPYIDVVEVNPEVIDISKEYFYVDKLISSNIIKEDANCYITECQKQYDSLLIDLYQDKAYPKHCTTEAFFKNCQKSIKPQGILMVNCANMSQYIFLHKQLRKVFGQSVLTITIPTRHNVILVAANMTIQSLIDKLPLNRLDWHSGAGPVGKLGHK